MSRVIKIEKVNNITLVSITEKGNTQTSYSSIRRNVTKHLNGVQIQPDPEEAAFNNFYIDLDELEDSFGAKTPEALIAQFAALGFFSGAANAKQNTMNQNNKVKVVELPYVNFYPGITPLDALAAHLNKHPDLEVKEDEILLINVGKFIPGAGGES